jgi:diguanylate cyclase (GGDEF)-like protein
MIKRTSAAYFKVAESPRFRATLRGRVRGAARQGLLLTGAMALLNSTWLVALHPEAALLILSINATVAAVATGGWVALATVAARRSEVVVFVVLIAVDLATVALAVGSPALALVAAGYMLLMPIIVALLIPWAPRTHVVWLAMHVALVLAYTLLAPAPDRPGARLELIGLLVVALLVSQLGHVSGLRHQAQTFIQVEEIKALNRQARRDRARLDSLNLALAESAATDALTGLGNRSALDAGLQLARSRMARQGERYGLMIIDLDHFKSINDERGHLGGDEVLRTVARAIREVLRPGDSAYRYGGEEFVVLIRVTRSTEAPAAAERIRLGVEGLQISSTGNAPYRVLTISVGVTTIGPDDLAADDRAWLAPADAALYRAKAAGRNRCETGLQRPASGRRRPRASSADRRPKRSPKQPVAAQP